MGLDRVHHNEPGAITEERDHQPAPNVKQKIITTRKVDVYPDREVERHKETIITHTKEADGSEVIHTKNKYRQKTTTERIVPHE